MDGWMDGGREDGKASKEEGERGRGEEETEERIKKEGLEEGGRPRAKQTHKSREGEVQNKYEEKREAK